MKATSKRILALLAGGLGLRAILRRRARAVLSPSPADELKAKLVAAKESEPEAVPPDSGEPPGVDAPSDIDEPPRAREPEGVDERRADVHARARHAIEQLREDGE